MNETHRVRESYQQAGLTECNGDETLTGDREKASTTNIVYSPSSAGDVSAFEVALNFWLAVCSFKFTAAF